MKKTLGILIFACLIFFMLGWYIGVRREIPFVGRENGFLWSVGIYTGDSPFNLTPPDNLKNPVLTRKDVTDVPADFIADPFMVNENNGWYMFFEALNPETNQGDIELAISEDGLL